MKYKKLEELKEELGDLFEEYMYQANIELLNKLDKIKSNNQLIIDYGFDYDGLNNVEDLKKLIDMLVDYAVKNKKILEE